MRKTTRATVLSLSVASALALGACGPESATGGSGSSSTTSKSSSTDEASPSTQSEKSSEDTTSSTTTPSDPTEDAGTTDEKNQGAALPEQAASMPSGPVTKATLVTAGGYQKRPDSKYGEFYAVLKVDGTGPGKATVRYDMLDASGKVIGTVEDTIKVGKGKDMIKISTKLGKAPAGIKKVRLSLTKNETDDRSDDITMSNVKINNDGPNRRPVITGNYAANGDSPVTGIRAICMDANKRVIVGHGLPDVKGAKSGTFKAELHEAPRDWKASTCYVGQSGTL